MRTQIGAAMGLAWTEMGGILLPVEVVTMVGKGELMVTGQLGDVMRESAMAALSYIRTRADELQIDSSFQDNVDLHIHLPENAIPKDGPSAGITIATALVSALTHRPVRNDLAMTGEVTLLGSVLAIGGLKEKVLAAQQANIRTIIIPAANQKDLQEIPAKIRQQINFIPVDNMDQVIETALLEIPDANENFKQNTHSTRHEERAAAQPDHLSNTKLPSSDEQSSEDPDTTESPTFIVPSTEKSLHNFYSSAHSKRDNNNIG
jgi:ATP-dependent Lon protease